MANSLLDWMVRFISEAGYPAIVALMAVESACIPLPSEIIMPFSGYLVSTGRLNLFLVAVAGAVGSNIGSTAAYLVGASGGRTAVLHWSRYILVGPRDLDRLDRFFNRFGAAAVLVGRVLPIARTFISLPAGIAKMPFLPFQIYTFLGSLPWCLALAYVGMVLGDQWNSNPSVQVFFDRFRWAVALVVIAGACFYVYFRWRAFRRDR